MTENRLQRYKEVISLRRNDSTILLENVFNPHNIAAIMRTCDAVGIKEIFVLNTRQAPQKHFGKKSSSSAEKWLITHQFTHLGDCLHFILPKYPHLVGTHLGASATSFWQHQYITKTCFILVTKA